jgi:hypothetical protein
MCWSAFCFASEISPKHEILNFKCENEVIFGIFNCKHFAKKKSPDLSTWKNVVKNIEGCLNFLLSYLIYGLKFG